MRTITHWTPQYIYDRLAVANYEKQYPEHPWLTQTAISILSSFLKDTDVGIEWGSGRSTAWLASRVKHLFSVEDNQEWYQTVKEKLSQQNLYNTEYYLETEQDSYVGVVNQFDENSLNFALVDGNFWRSTCALKVVSKIKLGGVIIIDNANWFLPSNSHSPNSRTFQTGAASDEWQSFLNLVLDWRTIWTSNGVTDTALFIRTA